MNKHQDQGFNKMDKKSGVHFEAVFFFQRLITILPVRV